MPVVLIPTPKAPNANTYATLVEFRAYHESHVEGEASTDLDDDLVNRALVQATRELDTYLIWDGWATTTTQALAFPRLGLTDPNTEAIISGDVIPERVKNACCEQARLIASRNRAVEGDTSLEGLQRLKAGPVELEFAKTDPGEAVVGQVIAPSAFQFVAAWCRMVQAGKGGTIPLVRM